MIKNSNLKDNSISNNFEEEIDLRNFSSFILRNKILITTLGFLSFAIACLYSLSLKRLWEGQFQIVLNSDDKSNITSLNPRLSRFIGSNKSNNLKTQVGILQSPSVLMPIYEFVNGEDNKDMKSNLPFYKWKNNLEIELQRDTSILNIAYRDTNKEIILPALKKMSAIYQDYSGRSIRREQELTENYLKNQINLFRKKSTNSIKAAQNFAIDQNLIYLGTNNNNNFSLSTTNFDPKSDLNDFYPDFIGSNVNIENIRVAAANKIRIINLQIKKINELAPSDYENLQYFGSSIPALAEEGLPQTLKSIEEKLVYLRTQYTEKDRSILRLLEERKLTVELLKSRAIKYLKVSKLEAEATMEAAIRPKGVLLQYKELIREAARDEATLVSLENDFRDLQLQKAKISDPWQLITQPTLLNFPVAPSRKTIGFCGLAIGLFIGLLISFYKEKMSDKIFSIRQLEQLLSTSILERIKKNDQMVDSKQIKFLKEYLKNQNAQEISFFTLEPSHRAYIQKLSDFLTKELKLEKKINYNFSQSSLEEFNKVEFIILFTSYESASFSEMQTFNSKINLLNIDLKGLILLDE